MNCRLTSRVGLFGSYQMVFHLDFLHKITVNFARIIATLHQAINRIISAEFLNK